jgi:hypothetical protein
MEQRFDIVTYQFTDQRIDPIHLPLSLSGFSQADLYKPFAFSCPHENRDSQSALSTSVQVEIPTERDGNPMQAAIFKNLQTVLHRINLYNGQSSPWRPQKIE